MFWNNECSHLSKLLGIPNDLKRNKSNDNFFPSNQGFYFYDGFNSKKINFNKIIIPNMEPQKKILRKKLLKIEKNRYDKEQKKYKTTIKNNNKDKKSVNKKISLLKKKLSDKHDTFMEKIETKINNLDLLIKTRKVSLNPSDMQVSILLDWIKSCDNVFNNLVDEFNRIFSKLKKKYPDDNLNNIIKKFKSEEESTFPINFIKLRNIFIHKHKKIYTDVPFCILANSIKEFTTSIKSIFTKISKGDLKQFEIKKRDIKRKIRTINVDKKYLSKIGPYPSILGELLINNKSNNIFIWNDVKKDFKIVYSKYNKKFYLHAPILVEKKQIKTIRSEVVSLDPGENKFVTGYSLNNCFYVDSKIRDRIRKRLKKIDKIKSKATEKKKRKRKWKYKKAINKHYEKIHHDVDEMHNKMNIFIVKNYSRVLMPKFSSRNVSSRKKDLNNMTKRVLGQMSHYKYRERLNRKCEEYSTQYIEVDESYTSQTCSICGTTNKKLKEAKNRIHKCEKCKIEIDRDMNGARNILIKNRETIMKAEKYKL